MNLLKKGIFSLLVVGFIASCEDDDLIIPVENTVGSGLTEITFSSFEATSGPDANGIDDGTYVTVKPLAIGVSSYTVDFGAGGSPVTISELGGSASYDYSNVVEETIYTITVTAISDKGLSSVSKTTNITVEHEVTAVTSAPSSPSVGLEEVLKVYSNGIEHNGTFVSYRYSAAGTDLNEGAAQQGEVTLESGNNILQYSRLSDTVGASIEMDEIVAADAFGSGIAATHVHLDVHSDFAVGIDKLKITLVNGSTEYTFNQNLIDGEWINLDLNLATDFSSPVVKFDEIKLELGAGGTANDAATLNLDNVYFYKPISSVIQNGDFDSKTDHWRFTAFTDGTTTPFGSSSDGSWKNYDGTANGSKTKGAKWTSSQSGGPLQNVGSRYAYQALKLTPNTDYVFEYEYAIKNDNANDPIGGRRMVGVVLDGHFVDGVDAVSALSSNLGNHVGTIAEGKFSSTRGTLVKIPFTSNDNGEVAFLFYAVTSKDGWIDNVKVYQQP